MDPNEVTYLDLLFDSKTNKENVSQFFSDSFNKQLFARFLKEENFLLLLVLGLDNPSKNSIRQNFASKAISSKSRAITKSNKVRAAPRTQSSPGSWSIREIQRLHYEITVELGLTQCWPAQLAFIADAKFEKLGRGKPSSKKAKVSTKL